MSKTKDIILRVKRPEGYEDVHPDILVSDMDIRSGVFYKIIQLTDKEKQRVQQLQECRHILIKAGVLSQEEDVPFLLSLLERTGVIE